MRKLLKNLMTIATAGVLALGTASLAACGKNFTPLGGNFTSGEVVSNGGFVVEKGEYVYFINGVETYTSDNTYGTPVKGALMRAKKSDIAEKKNAAETVIPSLMVAADYDSGIYIYGDRVYYATPNNVKNTQGVVENSYLDFKSAKLDGSDIVSYRNVSSNSTVYRFVSVGDTVYLLFVTDGDLYSYNTVTKQETELVRDGSDYQFNKLDMSDPYVYYEMSVTAEIDVLNDDGEVSSIARDYNQIYRVRADATEAPAGYDYAWAEDYLEAHDGDVPYLNLGEIVLDGIGTTYRDHPTRFTHDLKDGVVPDTALGYSYLLQSYTNGGIYFTRSDLAKTSTVGEDGWLYYLPADALGANWNSVSGNAGLDVVAQDTTHADSSSAIFYLEKESGKTQHYYLYVDGTNIIRAKVGENGVAETTVVAFSASGATLLSIDNTSDAKYDYVYYTMSGSTGNTVSRAVYNGTEEDYKTLGYEDNKPYKETQILNVEHVRSWYRCEIIDGTLYFADAESYGSTSYSYISAVDLKKSDGTLMNNLELQDYNEEYEKASTGEGSEYEKANDDGKANLATAFKYFFYTGETATFYGNIEEAETATGKQETLYSSDEVASFKEYTEKAGVKKRSDYVTKLGIWADADTQALADYWQATLQHYVAPTAEETSLPAWAWALIGVGIGLVVIGAGVALFFLLRKRGGEEDTEKKEKMYVDTTDDRDVDVYAPEEPAEEAEETSEEVAEEPTEEPAEETSEEASEVSEEPAEEAPAPGETPEGPSDEPKQE